MENPYVSAGGVHELSARQPSRALHIAAWSHLVLALWLGYGEYSAMLQFRELFAGFGAELPWPTQFVIDYPWLGLLLGATALWPAAEISWRTLSDNVALRRARRRLQLHAAGTMAVLLLFIGSAYLPIIKMGQAVGG